MARDDKEDRDHEPAGVDGPQDGELQDIVISALRAPGIVVAGVPGGIEEGEVCSFIVREDYEERGDAPQPIEVRRGMQSSGFRRWRVAPQKTRLQDMYYRREHGWKSIPGASSHDERGGSRCERGEKSGEERIRIRRGSRIYTFLFDAGPHWQFKRDERANAMRRKAAFLVSPWISVQGNDVRLMRG